MADVPRVGGSADDGGGGVSRPALVRASGEGGGMFMLLQPLAPDGLHI